MTTPVFLFSSLDDQSALGGLYFFANGGVYNPSGPNPAAQVAYLEQFASTAYAKICASKAEATFSASQCQHTSAEASFLNNLTVGGVTEYQALVNWFFLGNPTPNLVEPPVNYCNRGFYCNPSSSLALNAVCVGPGVDNASFAPLAVGCPTTPTPTTARTTTSTSTTSVTTTTGATSTTIVTTTTGATSTTTSTTSSTTPTGTLSSTTSSSTTPSTAAITSALSLLCASGLLAFGGFLRAL